MNNLSSPKGMELNYNNVLEIFNFEGRFLSQDA